MKGGNDPSLLGRETYGLKTVLQLGLFQTRYSDAQAEQLGRRSAGGTNPPSSSPITGFTMIPLLIYQKDLEHK